MRLVKDDENACPDPNGMQRGAWLLRRRDYPFCLPIFRIAISRGALCQGSEVYFWFRLLRLREIRLRRGLDKNFPQRESHDRGGRALNRKGRKEEPQRSRGLNVRRSNFFQDKVGALRRNCSSTNRMASSFVRRRPSSCASSTASRICLKSGPRGKSRSDQVVSTDQRLRADFLRRKLGHLLAGEIVQP